MKVDTFDRACRIRVKEKDLKAWKESTGISGTIGLIGPEGTVKISSNPRRFLGWNTRSRN